MHERQKEREGERARTSSRKSNNGATENKQKISKQTGAVFE